MSAESGHTFRKSCRRVFRARNCHQHWNPPLRRRRHRSAGKPRCVPPESMLHHMATSSIGRVYMYVCASTYSNVHILRGACACIARGAAYARAEESRVRARGMHTRARARS